LDEDNRGIQKDAIQGDPQDAVGSLGGGGCVQSPPNGKTSPRGGGGMTSALRKGRCSLRLLLLRPQWHHFEGRKVHLTTKTSFDENNRFQKSLFFRSLLEVFLRHVSERPPSKRQSAPFPTTGVIQAPRPRSSLHSSQVESLVEIKTFSSLGSYIRRRTPQRRDFRTSTRMSARNRTRAPPFQRARL
jgi:hypothetical protein